MRFKKSPSLLEGVKGTMEGLRFERYLCLHHSARLGNWMLQSSTDLVPSQVKYRESLRVLRETLFRSR